MNEDITERLLFEDNVHTYQEALNHYNGDFKKEFDIYAEVCGFDSFPKFDIYFVRVYIPMLHRREKPLLEEPKPVHYVHESGIEEIAYNR